MDTMLFQKTPGTDTSVLNEIYGVPHSKLLDTINSGNTTLIKNINRYGTMSTRVSAEDRGRWLTDPIRIAYQRYIEAQLQDLIYDLDAPEPEPDTSSDFSNIASKHLAFLSKCIKKQPPRAQ